MATQQPKSTPSFAGQFLKNYRKSRNLSQEEFAFDLGIEPRTLRAYENGERSLNNVHELRRIAELLDIELERLGLAASLYIPKTPQQIEEIIEHVWSLMDEVHVKEARTIMACHFTPSA